MRPPIALSVAAMLAATPGLAEPTAPDAVAFGEYGEVEASLTGIPGSPEEGAAIMADRGKGNCVACHQVTALSEVPWRGEVGPTLDGAGARWTEADLRGILVNAKHMFPGTIMPAFYKTSGFVRPGDGYTGEPAAEEDLVPILTAQEVEHVVAYLLTLEEDG